MEFQENMEEIMEKLRRKIDDSLLKIDDVERNFFVCLTFAFSLSNCDEFAEFAEALQTVLKEFACDVLFENSNEKFDFYYL